jgi:hypothetical protein
MSRRFRRPSPSLVISLIALFVALGGTTYAATGGNFILGQANSATSQTGLTSNNAGKALNVTQQSTGAGATALGLNVPAGKTPFTVNSGTKVTNLNADKLDGIDSPDLKTRPVIVNAFTTGDQLDSLPHSFTSHGGGVLTMFYGSGYSVSQNHPIGFTITVDGNTYVICQAFTNEANSHKACVPEVGVLTLGAGTHTLSFGKLPGTEADSNDHVTLMMLELPK